MRARSSLALLLLACGLASCSDERGPAERSAPTSSARPAPVPAPDGIVVEARLAQPAAAWAALRTASKGSLSFLPRSHGGLWASLAGLPIGFASEIDDSRPIVAALRATRGLEWAAAVPLALPERFLLRIRQEAADRLRVEPAAAEGLVALDRTAKGVSRARLPTVALAVMDGALLVGSNAAAVAALGPYLARTSARRSEAALFDQTSPGAAPPMAAFSGGSDDAPRLALAIDGPRLARLADALSSPLAPLLDSSDGSAVARLLDPAALRRSAEEALGQLTTIQARAELVDDAILVHARLRLHHAVAEPTRRLAIDRSAVREAPADSVLAVAWAEPATERLAEADETAAALLGWIGTASADLAPRANKVLRAVATGRGDATTIGLRCTGVGLTAFAAGATADDRALRRALTELFDLSKHPSVAKRLAAAELKATARKSRVPHWPEDLIGLRLRSRPRASSAPAPLAAGRAKPTAGPPVAPRPAPERLDPIELLTTAGAGRFVAVAGVEAPDTMRLLLERDEERSLARLLDLRAPTDDPARPVWAALALEPFGLARCAQGAVDGDWSRRLVATIGFAEEPTLAWIEVELGLGLLGALVLDEAPSSGPRSDPP